MSFEKFLFYVFAIILVLSATMVITRRNPVQAALFLVLAFFNSAGLWLLLEAEFLAIILVLVYVGAVMVLFVFVVLMLDINIAEMRAGFVRYKWWGTGVALAMVVLMLLVVGPGSFGLEQFPAPVPQPADYSNTVELGSLLYTTYLYPFEIAGAILLVAIIAAIGLTLRRRPDSKYQNPSRQISVRRADRVRIVKMDAEKKMGSK